MQLFCSKKDCGQNYSVIYRKAWCVRIISIVNTYGYREGKKCLEVLLPYEIEILKLHGA